jgi:hypothetical protein
VHADLKDMNKSVSDGKSRGGGERKGETHLGDGAAIAHVTRRRVLGDGAAVAHVTRRRVLGDGASVAHVTRRRVLGDGAAVAHVAGRRVDHVCFEKSVVGEVDGARRGRLSEEERAVEQAQALLF